MIKSGLKVVKSDSKKEQELKEKNKSLEAAISQIDQNFGKGSVMRLGQQQALDIEAISTGLADVIIAVPHGYLDAIEPNDERIADFCKKHNLVGFHVFELCEVQSKHTASCRNFAPLFGISEESATGSSCGALACYLTEHLTELGSEYVFEQGRAMNCHSIITASVESNNSIINSVKVGGFANSIGSVIVAV